MNILAVDDERFFNQYLYEYLQVFFECEVTIVSEPDQVMNILAQTKFNLILMDLMMPIPKSWTNEERNMADYGMNSGMVLFKKIREQYPEIFILIYSAKSGERMDEFSYYLRKPEQIIRIVEIIRDFINKQSIKQF